MRIHEAIKKAEEHGWQYQPLYLNVHLAHEAGERHYVLQGFLDAPKFWECLGKALHWNGPVNKNDGTRPATAFEKELTDDLYEEMVEAWQYERRRFVDFTNAGHPVEAFFETLK